MNYRHRGVLLTIRAYRCDRCGSYGAHRPGGGEGQTICSACLRAFDADPSMKRQILFDVNALS